MSWHPTRKILAVGWESGDVLIWNEHDHELHEVTALHSTGVQVIEWSTNGSRLITADQVSVPTNMAKSTFSMNSYIDI